MKSLKLSQLSATINKHKLATILAVGIAVRLILMPITAHPFDVYVWYDLSKSISSGDVFNLPVFPPYHLMLIPSAYLYELLKGILPSGVIPMSTLPSALNFYPAYNITVIPGLLFNFVVKIPFLLSDIFIALLLYKIVLTFFGSKRSAEAAALLWFLNPFVIWISAGWGMWDTLPVLFSLITFYLLLKGKFEFSAISLSIAILLKFYPAFFLVPIGIFLLKINDPAQRSKAVLRFFGVFGLILGLTLLPSSSLMPAFISSFIVPNSSIVSATVANPTVNPLSFGLTYWSLLQGGQTWLIPISINLVYGVSILSAALSASLLLFIYWRVSKFNFKTPMLDLNTAMLLSMAALFLSLRSFSEQWVMWILPALVIACVSGRIKSVYYWAISLVALVYVLLNCPLPFFFLPLVPWIQSWLLGTANYFLSFEPLRMSLMIGLGCLFSILTFIFFRKLCKPLK